MKKELIWLIKISDLNLMCPNALFIPNFEVKNITKIEHDEIVHVKKMGQYELVIFDTDEEKVEFLNQKKMILDARDPK